MSDTTSIALETPVRVERWPQEGWLFLLVVCAAILIWALLAISVFGLIYALLIGIFFFLAHVVFIAHLRGNAVRLGPDQMPELHDRVVSITERLGFRQAPAAYVVQAGGTLNALATRFLRSNFIVLYADLIDACGENEDALDFIVAHELGHLRAGHLSGRWFLLPGMLVPFLGSAYSRACEYTSDRYGMAASRDRERALDGLCILAAGAKQGPRVNRRALASQRRDLDSVWMKIGHWLSTHPPIAERLAVLDPALGAGYAPGRRATAGALTLIAAVVLLPIAGTAVFVSTVWPRIKAGMQQAAEQGAPDVDARAGAENGILSLAEALDGHQSTGNALPTDQDGVYQIWSDLHPGEAEPLDPWTGTRYGYQIESGEYFIWSTGPDLHDDSDDLYYSSGKGAE